MNQLRLSLALLTLSVFPAFARAEPADEERVRERIGGIRIPFIANRGQTDPAVAFYAPTFAGTVYVTQKGEVVYSLPAPAKGAEQGSAAGGGWTLTETAVGGRPRPRGEERAATGVSYFIGSDPDRWRSGIATYDSVALGEVWSGVDVRLRAHGRNVEKLFTVRPGAEPSRIRMRVAGAQSLRVNEAGGLVVGTGLGELTFTRPVAYQERDGVRRSVPVVYRAQGQEYGFSVGAYDPALPVVIDPLLQSTYLGGSVFDSGVALAIAVSGEVIVAGSTSSTNFPGTAGGAQASNGAGFDAFVARLNATLTALSQATYLGGGTSDVGRALAIAASGEVFVAGNTDSSNFPGTAGGAQPASGGGTDAFVARLNATLTTLNQATYLGGSESDSARALAIAASGEAFAAGETASTNFPGTAGGAQPAFGGGLDAVVARLNSTLTTLSQATYLGGSEDEFGPALAIAASGEVFVAGPTGSTNFPGTAGGAQAANRGLRDAFVARLNAALTTLNQATYLGGSGVDQGSALAIHPTSGEVFVAGATISGDFPGTAGGAQASNGGATDAFVARLNATLTALSQATYLGGNGVDGGSALAIAGSGEIYVAGLVSGNFPGTAGGAQPASGGGPVDAFVARLNATLTTLNQATYLGGSGNDFGGNALAIAASGEVYVAGATSSTNFPGTAGGAQASFGGGSDAFVARLTADLGPGIPTDIPTLSPWMLALLAVALASAAVFLMRRSA